MTDILIVGAGPAGLTAAVYARRAGMDVIVFDKSCLLYTSEPCVWLIPAAVCFQLT